MAAKPCLKWPGGKARLASTILAHVGAGKRLVEPFVGSASVFLASGHQEALLADMDRDVVNLHRTLQTDSEAVLCEAEGLFVLENATAEAYASLRDEFNDGAACPVRQAALALYVNKHCFNGLWRRNREGRFNAAFGRFATRPSVPSDEIRAFAERARGAVFRHQGFEATFAEVREGDVVYCDPPYAPLTKTANFTGYAGTGFGDAEQERLAALAARTARAGVRVVVSNHDTEAVRSLYRAAFPAVVFHEVSVRRSIAGDSESRVLAPEIIAVFAA